MWFRVVRAMSKALAATPLTVLLLPRPKLFRRRSRLLLDGHLRRKEKEEPSFLLRRRIGGGPDPWSSTVGGRGANSVTPRVSMPSILPPADGLSYDIAVAALTAGVALALLRFWDEIAKRGVFDQKTNRKLVHITVGLAFMLFWPLFSDASWASFFAALAPGINVVRMILMGKGILKNDAMVKSISRHGDYRELLKGPLYYACTITIATAFFWRTSPIAIAAICNLCAGDGIADIVGRRFGTVKLPYNKMKSFAGTMSMAIAGFITSVVYLYYYSMFGLCDYSWRTIAGFLVVSLSASVVESLPISTELDDNLTVPLTSMLKMNRKLVHISVGLVFMLFWPFFSDASWAPYLAAFVPGINAVRVILVGAGILKNDAMVKAMSRHGDYRELLKGPLYYGCIITTSTAVFWRASPIAVAAICNLCAGDGVADIVGRRFGTVKLPYNKMKSYAGTMSMAIAGFLSSVVYLYYYSIFGLCDYSWRTIAGLLVVSLTASVVESLPISTELDHNLTVPLSSMLVGGFIF